jgi:hypothetical protein
LILALRQIVIAHGDGHLPPRVSAAAMNFQKLLRAFWRNFLLCLLRGWGWIPVLQQQARLRTQYDAY